MFGFAFQLASIASRIEHAFMAVLATIGGFTLIVLFERWLNARAKRSAADRRAAEDAGEVKKLSPAEMKAFDDHIKRCRQLDENMEVRRENVRKAREAGVEVKSYDDVLRYLSNQSGKQNR